MPQRGPDGWRISREEKQEAIMQSRCSSRWLIGQLWVGPFWQQKSQRRVEVSQWKFNLDSPFGTCSGEHAVSHGRAECEASEDGAFYCFHQHLQRLLLQPSSLLCISTRLSLVSISIPWVEENKSELRAIVSLTQNVCRPKMSLQVLYVTCHITCDSW